MGKDNNLVIFLVIFFLAFSSFAFAGEQPSGIYYTKANIWYEDNEISSANYHKGNMIHAGSKVEIAGTTSRIIKFIFGRDAAEFIISKSLHTKSSIENIFKRYFSKDNPLESDEYLNFSNIEKENIKKGQVVVGMSKAAVAMAYGYPVSQDKTEIDSDSWTYARSRFQPLYVIFSHGVVASINEEKGE